ncbi:MAG TPA: hypothetical protein VHH35_17175 [Pyrinomonadaceae bacterium]|nr:hypothetical protein [Pyrinomonadaceae bacterium]
MKIAYGLKAHSGWAALVALGRADGDYVVVDRRRVELVEEEWAKQPYHAAEELKPDAARKLVKRGIDSAHRIAIRELRRAVTEERRRKNEVTACAVLVGNQMPDWNVEQILAVHFRMHQAEGVLFRDALIYAAKECGVKVIEVPEKTLSSYAEQSLGVPFSNLSKTLSALGRHAGPPWGRDQKDAALAAMIALRK